MDIASVFNNIVEELNESSDCCLCWKFNFGGRKDYLNLAKIEHDESGDCCVSVGVIKSSFKNEYDTSGGEISKKHTDWYLDIFIGIPSRLDIQFYDEVDPSDKESSKWSKYLYPISQCLEDMPTRICGLCECGTTEIVSWTGEMKLNYLDNNYDGWLIKSTFRQWLNL